jgi:hypothetical protein
MSEPAPSGEAAGALDRPALLAQAARALAAAPADADDALLVDRLASVVLPALGEIAALYTATDAGEIAVASTTAAGSGLAGRLQDDLAQHPEAAAGYAEIMAQGQARLGQVAAGSGADEPSGLLSWHHALGMAAEILAPLGSDARRGALLTIGTTDERRRYAEPDLATVEVLAALLKGKRTARELARREARLQQQLEEGTLAGRELAHLLNNDLTMPVGVMELLMDRGTISGELQEMIQAAVKDLAALEQHVRGFHDLMRVRSSGPGPGGAPGPAGR